MRCWSFQGVLLVFGVLSLNFPAGFLCTGKLASHSKSDAEAWNPDLAGKNLGVLGALLIGMFGIFVVG